MLQSAIVIIHASYIIQKGLTKIISDICNELKIISLSSISELNQLFSEYDIKYLIIEKALSEKIKTIDNSSLEHIQIIYLDDNSKTYLNRKEIINIYDSKFDLINKLESKLKPFKVAGIDEKEDELSIREKEIVEQIALGKTNQEIADILFISPHTVVTHRKNITKKLGIKTVSGLTVYAILNNIISIDK